MRIDAPWRDLPDEFRPWNSVFKRFCRGAQRVFEQIFNVLSGEPDFEYAMIDGVIIRVHQHGMGAKRVVQSGHRTLARRLRASGRRGTSARPLYSGSYLHDLK